MSDAARTVHEALVQAVARWPEHDFLYVTSATAAAFGIEPGTTSYREMAGQVNAAAQAYRSAGFGHGHRVGLMLENRPEFFVHWFALNSIGASVVPLNADWRSAEIEYVVGHSELCHVLAIDDRLDLLRNALRTTARPVGRCGLSSPAPKAPAAPAPFADRAPDAQTECALLYTSGTTGRPKGCILSNEYFLHAGRWYTGCGGLAAFTPGAERLITPLPLVHMNAMSFSTMAMLVSGGCVVQLDRFHPGSWWDGVRESRATICHYLGVMPAMLLGHPADARDRAHALRFGLGSGVAREQHAQFEQRFGLALLEGWAMTETGAGAIVFGNHEPRHAGTNAFGRPEPWLAWRVVDDDGRDVPRDTPGEMLVRAAGANPRFGFFSGYLKDEAATAEAWAEGWFHTGDLVRVDEAGNFYFVDRKKNIIRRSGENIAAVEVEGVLLAHPRVKTVGVAPVPDPVRGDEVAAFVVTDTPVADEAALAAELATLCRGRLAYYKAPGWLAFCSELPLTPTQKIQRAELKAMAREWHAQGRCHDLRALKGRR